MDILEQSLGRVEAPAELWERVVSGRVSKRRSSAPWILAMAFAAAAMAWAFYTPAVRSDNPAAVREWVKVRTGMDVPLAHSTEVQLTGARVKAGKVELAYRAGDRSGVVLVSKAESGRGHGAGLLVECEAPACGMCHS